MDTVDELFSDAPDRTLYPGSRRTRKYVQKPELPQVSDAALAELMDPSSWGISPVTKTIQGQQMTLYTFGALATALQRPLITVRQWENAGRIPPAPFRAEHIAGVGGKVGRRYYTQRSINNAQMAFYKRGLLGASRVEWLEHPDLTEEIAQEWSAEINEFLSSTEGDQQ